MFSMFHIRIGMFSMLSMFAVLAQFDLTLTLHDDTNRGETVRSDIRVCGGS